MVRNAIYNAVAPLGGSERIINAVTDENSTVVGSLPSRSTAMANGSERALSPTRPLHANVEEAETEDSKFANDYVPSRPTVTANDSEGASNTTRPPQTRRSAAVSAGLYNHLAVDERRKLGAMSSAEAKNVRF